MTLSFLFVLFYFVSFVEMQFLGEQNLSAAEKFMVILWNPLKYTRSLFYHPIKQHKKRFGFAFHREMRETSDIMKDSNLYHHYILRNKPVQAPCSDENNGSNTGSAMWKFLDFDHLILSPNFNKDANGNLRIDHVTFSHMGYYSCTISEPYPKVYIHQITVISLPKIRIEVKLTYTADSCNSYERASFTKAMTQVMRRQVCPHYKCHVIEVNTSCENDKKMGKNLEFEVKVVILIYEIPNPNCGIRCSIKNLHSTAFEVRQTFEQNILRKGKISQPDETFTHIPKAIIKFVKNLYCDTDFVLSSSFCEPCKPGTFYENNVCHPCPMDTYNPHYGLRRCYSCGETRETFVTGASSIEQCTHRNHFITFLAILFIIITVSLKVLCFCCIKRFFVKTSTSNDESNEDDKNKESNLNDNSKFMQFFRHNSQLSVKNDSDTDSSTFSSSVVSQSELSPKNVPKLVKKYESQVTKVKRNKKQNDPLQQNLNAKGDNIQESMEKETKLCPNYIKTHAKSLKSKVSETTLNMKSPIMPLPPPPPPPWPIGKDYLTTKDEILEIPQIPRMRHTFVPSILKADFTGPSIGQFKPYSTQRNSHPLDHQRYFNHGDLGHQENNNYNNNRFLLKPLVYN